MSYTHFPCEIIMIACDHTSVGILVWNRGALLLIQRARPPFGFAPPAGHVDNDPSYEDAARRELKEETGLDAISLTLVAEGRKSNPCRRPHGTWHYWKIYKAMYKGALRLNIDEATLARWVHKDALGMLAGRTREFLLGGISDSEWQQNPGIEPVWYEWLQEIKII